MMDTFINGHKRRCTLSDKKIQEILFLHRDVICRCPRADQLITYLDEVLDEGKYACILDYNRKK